MTIDELLKKLGGRKAVNAALGYTKHGAGMWVYRGSVPRSAQIDLIDAFPEKPVLQWLGELANTKPERKVFDDERVTDLDIE